MREKLCLRSKVHGPHSPQACRHVSLCLLWLGTHNKSICRELESKQLYPLTRKSDIGGTFLTWEQSISGNKRGGRWERTRGTEFMSSKPPLTSLPVNENKFKAHQWIFCLEATYVLIFFFFWNVFVFYPLSICIPANPASISPLIWLH